MKLLNIERAVNALDRIFTVEYSIQDETLGKIKLTRSMKQPELGTLLLNPSVTLLAVDRQKRPYKRTAKKG